MPPTAPDGERRTQRQETQAVRRALVAAGLTPLSVGHGRGTAWGWLHVYIEGPQVPKTPEGWDDHQSPEYAERLRLEAVARGVVEAATSRDGSKDDIQTDYFSARYIVVVHPREVS